MRYRKFGDTGFEVSVLSLDTQCLNSMSNDEAVKVMHCAIDHGVNYFSIDHRNIEAYGRILEIVGKVLRERFGDKERIKISIALPISSIGSVLDLNNYLEKSLETLRLSKIDFCFLKELNRETWLKLQRLNILNWVDDAIEKDKMGEVGFSFHDDFQILRDIILAYDKWSFCQLQYSYVDVNHHPGVTGLKYAARSGLAIVVADPFKNGNLLKNPPEPVVKAWGDLLSRGSLAEWGLRWIWNHPEVSTVAVKVSGVKQLLEYVALAEKSDPDNLSIHELIVFENVKDAYFKLRPINCAICRCCMPCPQGIDVPRIFELYNDALTYDDVKAARLQYEIEQHKIEKCNECGECVNKCPRKIPITYWLKEARNLLAAQSNSK